MNYYLMMELHVKRQTVSCLNQEVMLLKDGNELLRILRLFHTTEQLILHY